jgi:hypothetical protein
VFILGRRKLLIRKTRLLLSLWLALPGFNRKE